MDESDELVLESASPELRELLGLFDVPAFARRGQDLETVIRHLHDHCHRERQMRLEMVRVRLRQWAACVTGPADWSATFTGPLDALWAAAGAGPLAYAARSAPLRRQRACARDLAASVLRFNRRWVSFLEKLNLKPINDMIDDYNRYYLFEKECFFRSPRLALRYFAARERITPERLLSEYPRVPVPGLRFPCR
jgi:hypothetical protein